LLTSTQTADKDSRQNGARDLGSRREMFGSAGVGRRVGLTACPDLLKPAYVAYDSSPGQSLADITLILALQSS